jgi:ABC-type transport system involved in multi-copper enzyme maturation permease subunit
MVDSTAAAGIARRIIANPNLWSQFVGEIFKWRRHSLYRWFVMSPFIFGMVVAMGMAFSPAVPDYANIDGLELSASTFPYNLGMVGTFAMSGQAMMSGYLPMFTIGFVLVAGWCVYSEFNWRTIKMVASRQPNRVHLVLAKVMFVAGLMLVCMVSFTLSWWLLAVFLKLLYGVPLGLTANDTEAISLGLSHVALRGIAMFMWALPTMAAVYALKAATGGVLLYFVYTGVESFLSNLGALAINTPEAFTSADGFFQTALEIGKTIYPFLLTTHLNRITMVAVNNPQVDASIPLAMSWIAVGVYVLVFVGIMLWIFVPRDIKE